MAEYKTPLGGRQEVYIGVHTLGSERVLYASLLISFALRLLSISYHGYRILEMQTQITRQYINVCFHFLRSSSHRPAHSQTFL